MGFSVYLQSVIADYAKQPNLYTLTDLQVEYWEEKGRSPDSTERQPEKKVERLEVLAGLRKYVQKGQVLLVGKPGSGKSTALQRLRWELAQAALGDEQQPIPVLVALRGDRPILDAICAEFRRTGERFTPEEINEWLLDGRLFLLLDGLNEIPSQEREHQIDQFRRDNPRMPMIFTSRELGTGLGIEQKLEMCRLTERQMRSFVEKYLPNHAEVLLRQLKDRLRELAETPSLLKLLCDVFDPVTQQISQSKGELFRAVDAKYNDWKQREGMRTAEKFWQWNSEILRYLAFVMLQADGTPTGKWLQIECDHAERLLEQFLQGRVTAPGEKAKDWLQDLLEHHLLQPAANPTQIEFHHQLLQEYYAAEYLLRQLPTLSEAKLKHDYLNLLKWTEPLALMLSLASNENEKDAVQLVKLALDIDLYLGARLAGAAQKFQGKTIALVKCLPETREIAEEIIIELLGKTGSEQAIPSLLQILSDSNSVMKAEAAIALGEIKTEHAVSGLFQFIEKHRFRGFYGHDIFCAIDSLSRIGSEQAISVLFKLLNNPNPSLREDITAAIGKIGSEMIPVLIKLTKDDNVSVQMSAIEALGEIRSEKTIPALLNLLKDVNYHIRVNAAEALGKIGSEQAIFALIDLLKNSNSDIRNKAIHALRIIRSEQAIPTLVNLLKDSNYNIRANAAYALGELRSKQAIPGLIQAFYYSDDYDPDCAEVAYECWEQDTYARVSASAALSKIGSEEAIEPLRQALNHSNSDMRICAALGLGNLCAEQTFPFLLEALDSSEDYIVASAAHALGEIASKQAIEPLKQAWKDSLDCEGSLVEAVVFALGRIIGAEFLRQLWIWNLSYPPGNFIDTISTIQANCQFYSYEIFHSPPALPQPNPQAAPSTTINNYVIDQVGDLNTGDVTIHGDQIGVQHKSNPKE